MNITEEEAKKKISEILDGNKNYLSMPDESDWHFDKKSFSTRVNSQDYRHFNILTEKEEIPMLKSLILPAILIVLLCYAIVWL